MRKFGKATRDDDTTKMDIEGFYSPLVVHRWSEYMNKHQETADGRREGDNWQSLFGEKHNDVCIKSLLRHVLDLWLFHRGKKGRDNIEEALCAIIFNAQAYLYKVLKDRNYLE